MKDHYWKLVGLNEEPYKRTAIEFQTGEFKDLEGQLMSYTPLISLQERLKGRNSLLDNATLTKNDLSGLSYLIDKNFKPNFQDNSPISDPVIVNLFLFNFDFPDLNLKPIYVLTEESHDKIYHFFRNRNIINLVIEDMLQHKDTPYTIFEYYLPQKLSALKEWPLEEWGPLDYSKIREIIENNPF